MQILCVNRPLCRFEDAAKLFKECADICHEDPSGLLRFNSPKYYGSSILCALAAEEIQTAKDTLSEISDEYEGFRDSEQARICREVSAAVEAMDPEALGLIWTRYSIQLSKLDKATIRYIRDQLQNFTQDDNPEDAPVPQETGDVDNPDPPVDPLSST